MYRNVSRFKDHIILDEKIIHKMLCFYKKANALQKRKIRNCIVSTNYKFIYAAAFGYTSNFDVPLNDMIGYGIQGMFEAIEKFDPTYNVKNKFISYAAFWVKQGILSNIQNNESLIRLPLHIHTHLQAKVKNNEYTNEVLEKLNMMHSTSLDRENPDTKTKLSDSISDNKESFDPEQNLSQKESAILLYKAMCRLPPDELDVIKAYYGINQNKETVLEIAERSNTGKENIRVRKNKALEKLKKSLSIRDKYTRLPSFIALNN